MTETINNQSYIEHLAWLPNNDTVYPELQGLEERAVDWLLLRADDEDNDPVVFVNASKSADGFSAPFNDLIRRYSYTYPLDRSKPRKVPILALYPGARSLHMAMNVARGSSLMVIESISRPLHGWAAATGAVDVTGAHEPTGLISDEARKALDHALFFTGNNNWTGSHEKSHAKSALRSVVSAGLLDTETAVGYALGHARVSDLGAKNLEKIINGLS